MQNNNMDKSLFFITLSCICVWLVVDMAIGKNYLGNFLTIIFPFMESEPARHMTEEETKEAASNAPTSSAIGGNKEKSNSAYTWGGSRTSSSVPGSMPYGATR